MELNKGQIRNIQLYSKFDQSLAKLVDIVSPEFFKVIKRFLIENGLTFGKSSLQVDIVVDTNILFKEVRGLMLSKKSFLLSLADFPFIRLYAPSTIKEELFAKIEE